MSDYLSIVLAGALLLISVVLILLLREQKKLKRDYRALEDKLRLHGEDLAGLCSAAVEVDRHLAGNDARLDGLIDLVNAYRSAPPAEPVAAPAFKNEPPGEYDNVIQKIRRGVDVDELVKDCGLTRDEAVLLMSLHGGRR